MAEIIEKDILSITDGILCHSVNCMGKMGKGIALDIKLKWRHVYDKYMDIYYRGQWKLGLIQVVSITDKLFVANMATQFRYGRDKRYVDYDAFRMCLQKVIKWVDNRNVNIYFPYKISSSSAGGDWNIILKIINQEIPTSIICKKP